MTAPVERPGVPPPLARARARFAGKPDPRYAGLTRNGKGQFARPADAAPPADPPIPKGLGKLRTRIALRGLGAVDRRLAPARAVLGWKKALVEDLGGEAALSAQRRALVEVATRSKLYLDHIDAVLLERRSLLTHKKARVLPLVEQRRRFADSLTRTLVALGVDRRRAARTLTLAERLAEQQNEQ